MDDNVKFKDNKENKPKYFIDSNVSKEEREEIIKMIKEAMKHRKKV
jgi:hypothetical protein